MRKESSLLLFSLVLRESKLATFEHLKNRAVVCFAAVLRVRLKLCVIAKILPLAICLMLICKSQEAPLAMLFFFNGAVYL